MTCTPYATPIGQATQGWARAVEMQMAMAQSWLDWMRLMNPMLPAVNLRELAMPHAAPAAPKATPAAKAKAKPAPRKPARSRAAAKPASAEAAMPAPAPSPAKPAPAKPKTTRAKASKPAAAGPEAEAKPKPKRRKQPTKPEQPFSE